MASILARSLKQIVWLLPSPDSEIQVSLLGIVDAVDGDAECTFGFGQIRGVVDLADTVFAASFPEVESGSQGR